MNERNPEDLAFYELARKEKWRKCPKVGFKSPDDPTLPVSSLPVD